jgi:ketosteroid isomerase-like protein
MSSSDLDIFRHIIARWAAGDLEGALQHFTEEILYLVNVDGIAVPFVSSALGKEDLRQRLQGLIDIFHQVRFEPESIVQEVDSCRAIIDVHNIHKATGEQLRVKLRLRYWFENGLVARVEERLDAPYMEAFQRLVLHHENAARSP